MNNNKNYLGNNMNITPIKIYNNMFSNKKAIYKENKHKHGIYSIFNPSNNKGYVGSAVSLTRRFYSYYSIKTLKRKSTKSSLIYFALLKYGHSNFNLVILEYCEKSVLLKREAYYYGLLNPEYNVRKIPRFK